MPSARAGQAPLQTTPGSWRLHATPPPTASSPTSLEGSHAPGWADTRGTELQTVPPGVGVTAVPGGMKAGPVGSPIMIMGTSITLK